MSGNLATLTKVGRAAFVKAMKERALFLAWGGGDPAWDEGNAEFPNLADATALEAEVGRRAAALAAYAVPDDAGDIVIPKGQSGTGEVVEARYALSETPTPYLYVQTQFNFADAADEIIRELAVFVDSVPIEGLPPGQRYFLPGEIADPGLMLAVQIFSPPITRSPAVRQIIDFVLPM
jgi:hypothetical protein